MLKWAPAFIVRNWLNGKSCNTTTEIYLLKTVAKWQLFPLCWSNIRITHGGRFYIDFFMMRERTMVNKKHFFHEIKVNTIEIPQKYHNRGKREPCWYAFDMKKIFFDVSIFMISLSWALWRKPRRRFRGLVDGGLWQVQPKSLMPTLRPSRSPFSFFWGSWWYSKGGNMPPSTQHRFHGRGIPCRLEAL